MNKTHRLLRFDMQGLSLFDVDEASGDVTRWSVVNLEGDCFPGCEHGTDGFSPPEVRDGRMVIRDQSAEAVARARAAEDAYQRTVVRHNHPMFCDGVPGCPACAEEP